ncbi:MAG: Spy0128 family protein [Faecousia sp.]
MKKLISLALALVFVLSMATVAFATPVEEEEAPAETTYTDMSTVTLTKEYKLTNAGTISPAETFTFTGLTCTSVTDAAAGVTIANAPVPTIGSVSYIAGEAGSETAKKDITINLPGYTSVGIYTYTFSEIDGGTAGVSYRSAPITLVVTVIEQNGKVRVAGVHTEDQGQTKSGEFNNEYSAGSLSVKKVVTGILGDQKKEFTVKVTFTAPTGDTVRNDITYMDGTTSMTIAAGDEGWNDTKEVEITLKHNETVTFNNIPYGVTYTVTEENYTSDGYDAAAYSSTDTDTEVNTASETVTITNNKGGTPDTGITLDTLPFVLILAVCAGAVVLFVIKRRGSAEF